MGGGDTKTVFIRYSPALSTLTRHHLEAICSEVGPVKKCSLIRRRDNNNNNSSREDQFRNNNTEALGYAFVKFLSNEDALEAIEKLNKKNVQFNQITGELKVLGGGASKKNTKGAEGVSILTFLVELGRDANSKAADTNKSTKSEKKKDVAEKISDKDQQAQDDDEDEELTILQKRKRNARLIIRNLSFYANEKDIRKFMENQFGPLLEVTLPLVRTPGSGKAQTQHRGFAFVTFENPMDAHKAVNFKGDLIIRKRKVNVSFSVSKAMHTQQKQEEEKKEKKVDDHENGMNDEESSDSNSSDDDGSKSSSDTDSETDSDSDSDDDDDESMSDEDETDESSDKEDDEEEEEEQKVDPAILQKRSLFLRNLPYDVTRHDIFELFSPYGYVSKIYIVKDYDTGVPKGTAFVEYKESSSAEKAMKAASPDLDIGVDEDNDDNNSYNEEDNNEGRKKSSFSLNQNEDDTKRSTSQQNQNSIFLINGRQIFVNYAVDKNTANTLTLTSSEQKESKAVKIGKDKRNLYLKNEGRVTEQDGWDDLLPESDKEKRGRAHNEKSQKLRSPIFFINPFRLSIRNLSKHIQKDSQLRQLIIEGVQRGLDRNVVSKQDLWLHERAKGEAKVTDENQRKVLGRNEMLQMEVPEFDTKTLKKYIPSVHIEKDPMSQNSKGFGFVEFSHHAHALACLRELNNNPRYTGDYVAGGKRALIAQEQGKRGGKKKKKNTDGGDDDKTKIPRLIVEFTVENKVKARLQAEKRARQLKNMEENPKKRKVKQKKNDDDDDDNTENPRKQSRGAKQREKKRKRKEMELLEKGGTSGTNKGKKSNTFSNSNSDTAFNNNKSKNKTMKPPKKQKKLDKEEQAFDDMVRSYKASFASASTTSSLKSIDTKQTKSREKPRWFD